MIFEHGPMKLELLLPHNLFEMFINDHPSLFLMEPINAEAEYAEIISVIKEHGGSIDYKTLNERLGDKFEGVRLRLKTMKEKGLVHFEGVVPSFDSTISVEDF